MSSINQVLKSDMTFVRKYALPYFGIKKVGFTIDYSTKKFPDIWCYPDANPPVIVVTQEWARQRAGERRKRIVHELLHISGLNHSKKIGYNSRPDLDTYSQRVYNEIEAKMRYPISWCGR